MKRTIEMKDVVDALQLTPDNIRQREGRSFPPAISDRPRVYVLADVLWWINAQERTVIMQAMGIDVAAVRAAIASVVEHPRYIIPSSSFNDSDDPLMQ